MLFSTNHRQAHDTAIAGHHPQAMPTWNGQMRFNDFHQFLVDVGEDERTDLVTRLFVLSPFRL
ncbi:MAG: hypothetical protein ACOYNV_21760 [Propionivibrio sp.]